MKSHLTELLTWLTGRFHPAGTSADTSASDRCA